MSILLYIERVILKELKLCAHSTLEIKKSKFISYLIPYKDFKETKLKLKEQYPKARHIVYAYRYLNEFDQIVENQSDDGEPKGSSGAPALAVLRGYEAINCAVLIVRFFGGVKLGIGGLVRAYTQSVNEALACAEFNDYQKLLKFECLILFSKLAKFEHFLKTFDQEYLRIEKEFLVDGCNFHICAPENDILKLNKFLATN